MASMPPDWAKRISNPSMSRAGFSSHRLDDDHVLWCGRLPDDLLLDPMRFEELWSLHPQDYHEIEMHGRTVKTPRWQQAYGADYHYTGRVNRALPVPALMQPYLDWSTQTVDQRINGLLLNWYDGGRGHYIGKHRDSIKNMAMGAPIVTISFGQERIFRLRPWRQKGIHDFLADDGRVFIMPYETNRSWTHEVPKSAKYTGRRISLTLRAFITE